ncbi:MAG: iron-sulfur cluster insertion protein ErpA, partial [Polyangiales bacterium]
PQPVARADERPYTRGARSNMLNLTDRAAEKVKEIRDSEGLVGQGLRVRVIGGGCAGFSYDLFFEDETTDLDQTFESHGIPIYVDMMSAQYLDGTEIDYVEGLQGAGFKFVNPQAKQTCGCGSSFAT